MAFDIPAQNEQELLERYGALAFDKQTDLYELIGDNDWDADLQAGTISFGPQLMFPVQVLGTFSHSSHTWLWAWANEQANQPEALLREARQLREYGQRYGIDLLRVGQFDAVSNDLHLIGAVAVGMFGDSAYYLANYGAGTMVVTLKSKQIERVSKNGFARISTTFPQVISMFEMHHRPAFMHYISQKGFAVAETTDTITGTSATGTFTATFDEQGRLTSLKGTDK